LLSTLTLTGIVESYDYFSKVWWSQKNEKFLLKEDWCDALQADKFGHFFASYVLADYYQNLLLWANFDTAKAKCISFFATSIYEIIFVELTDGFTTKWGFSISDVLCDLLGSYFATYSSLNKRIEFKISYTPSKSSWLNYITKGSLKDALYRKQITTDYDGMTFWIIYNKNWIINPAIGYSIENVYKANAYREFFLSFDFNLIKIIPTKSKELFLIKKFLNYFHLPSPALQIYPYFKFYLFFF